jgi:hypothetical protein
MKRVSFGIVIAALLVSAPRLTLAFLLGDGIRVPEQMEVGILTVTGVGSGIVLTAGNALVAHALAVKAQQRSGLWWLEAAAWLLFLVGAVIVMAPTLVAGLTKSSLNAVLQTSQSKWLWAVTAVVIVELLVGAAMAASILAQAESAPSRSNPSHPSLLSRLGAVLVTRLEQSVAPTPPIPGPSLPAPMPIVEAPPLPIPTNGVHPPHPASNGEKKEEALAALLEFYRQHPNATLSEVCRRIGRSAPTVRAYRKELQARGHLPVNGQAEVEP